jgi:hypothetical protein
MDCAPQHWSGLDDGGLAALVASLEAGSSPVVVGVLGEGLGPARRAVAGLAPVSLLPAPEGAQIADLSATVAQVPGRCVVLVRAGADGWEVGVPAGSAEPILETATAPADLPAVVPHERVVDGRVFASSLRGEAIGAAAGAGIGLVGAAWIIADSGGSYAAVLPWVVAIPVGTWSGAAVGASRGARERKGAAVAGSLLGSAVGVGLVGLAAAGNGTAFVGVFAAPAVVVGAPLGAALAVGRGNRERTRGDAGW